jgi:hypothetical protein
MKGTREGGMRGEGKGWYKRQKKKKDGKKKNYW